MTSLLSDSDIESIESVRANSFAANTIRNNNLHWRAFVKWLKNRGSKLSLPIDPELVALYLVEIADRYSFSYISNATKGIKYEHRQAKCLSPTTSAIVKEVMAGLYRTLGGRQQQAKPLFYADVEAINRTAFIPRPSAKKNMSEGGYEKPYVALRRGKLDIAITCMMFEGLLRSGEAEELRWRDISYAEDGSGVALIRYSKTDQEGAGAYVWLSPDTMKALDDIRPETPDEDARVFRLGRPAIVERIQKSAKFAGLDKGHSGHSPRVGMIYELVMADISPSVIIQAARWKDDTMLVHYTRHIQATRSAVAQLYSGKSLNQRRFRIDRPPVTVRHIEQAKIER